jgi:RNA polymerase sigma-70 factor (ECF subfamily)
MPEKTAPGYECVPYRRGAFVKRFIGVLLRDSSDINSVARADFLSVKPAKLKSLIEGPRSLFLCIAKPLVLLRLRRKNEQIKRYVEDSAELEVVGQRLSEHALSVTEALRMHCEAVAELSNPCRQIYLLRKARGLSHKEIGAYLGIGVSAVEKHLLEAVEHCDRYVRESGQPFHWDLREGQANVGERDCGKRGGIRRAGVDRARSAEVAHSDGQRGAAHGS